jgi:hypothetical protein
MADVEAMTTRVRVLCGRHNLATVDDIRALLNSRHAEQMDSYDWSRSRQAVIIGTKADKTTGTIAVTQDSSTVVGTGTAFDSTDIGRSITISDQNSYFQIKAVASATSFTLGDLFGNTVTYPGATASGLSFCVFTRLYSVGAGIEQIISVTYQSKLTETSTSYLDAIDPSRKATSDGPVYFARGERLMTGTNDIVRIEFHPRPSSPIAINVGVKLGHTDLGPSDNPIVPSAPLEWGAAIDMAYSLHARTSDKGSRWLILADKWTVEFEKALEKAKAEDSKKFGVIQSVTDIYGDIGRGDTDFGLNHDV